MKILVPAPAKRDVTKSNPVRQLRRGIDLVKASQAPYALKAEMIRNLEDSMIEISLKSLFVSQKTSNN